MTTSKTRIAVATVIAGGLVATGGLAALAAGTGTVTPPARIAFVARSDNPADALAVGPTAGQLGAPMFVTAPGSLVPSTQEGLTAYAPELVIIAGGEAAIAPSVEQAIEAALGLPDDKVVRASGSDRHETAVEISELLAAHNPAFLPVDATATDSDLLDGLDSTAFVKATDPIDADTLAGESSGEIGVRVHAYVGSTGSVASTSRGIENANVRHADTGVYCIGGLGFAPVTGQVTVEASSGPATRDRVARILVSTTGTPFDCDPGENARVEIYDISAGALVDSYFYVWLDD